MSNKVDSEDEGNGSCKECGIEIPKGKAFCLLDFCLMLKEAGYSNDAIRQVFAYGTKNERIDQSKLH